jgi:hypothetical protein
VLSTMANMGALEALLQYIRQSERLVVVTLTVTVAGLALLAVGQWQLFRGLPEWVLPAALIGWALCAVHIVIRAVMALSSGIMAAARFIASIPQRRRTAAYGLPVIQRLLRTDGLEREVLCYALYWDKDHFRVRARDRDRLRWLFRLRQDGLVEMSGVGPEDVQYRIHHVAWEYMRKYPNRFVTLLPWSSPPWALDLDEDKIERLIREEKAKPRI